MAKETVAFFRDQLNQARKTLHFVANLPKGDPDKQEKMQEALRLCNEAHTNLKKAIERQQERHAKLAEEL